MDDTEERYQSALDYLYTFIDFSLTRQDRLAAANFDLKRMFALMELLGNPQNRYPVIHVAGTKARFDCRHDREHIAGGRLKWAVHLTPSAGLL